MNQRASTRPPSALHAARVSTRPASAAVRSSEPLTPSVPPIQVIGANKYDGLGCSAAPPNSSRQPSSPSDPSDQFVAFVLSHHSPTRSRPNSAKPSSPPKSRPNSAHKRAPPRQATDSPGSPRSAELLSVADAHAQLCGSSGYYCLGASGASATVAVVAEPKPTVVADNQPNLSIGEARARAGSAGAPLIAPLRPASATARLAGLEASVQAGPRRALHAMSQRYRSKAGLASSRLFRAEPHSSIAEEPAPLSPEDGEAALPADYEIALAALAAAAAADPLGGASDENQDLPIGRPPPPLGHVSKLLSAYATPQTTVVRSRYARQRHWDASTAVDDDRHAVGETLGAPGAALITAPGAMTSSTGEVVKALITAPVAMSSSTGELAVDCFGTKPAAGREHQRSITMLVHWLLLPTAMVLPSSNPSRVWDVTLVSADEQRHTLSVAENQSVLRAAELAGLLPCSDCRRGRCLSCAARVVSGSKFSLAVDSDTALCDEAHVEGIVLLCSAYPRGPNLELKLDAEGDALEIQYEKRFRSGAQPPPPRKDRPATAHFHSPEDLIVHLERCLPSQRKPRQER
ncbi:ferredoxin (2fe-2s) [Chrysochromulina tobinii]|uniref:Ferredoxin (2fe-2s) n=1 Tax=Chrysochromulina tobinii TaxID=1460289 RepID=A0A0M0K3H8_9EUKA|nr:ferredoxin (2fe-2s) [Chrysochromulina tobinii]|eukprot:KOO32933.1 ferredoxin (2fe-2s) [Chrysochromulina sp. CCMP291]